MQEPLEMTGHWRMSLHFTQTSEKNEILMRLIKSIHTLCSNAVHYSTFLCLSWLNQEPSSVSLWPLLRPTESLTVRLWGLQSLILPPVAFLLSHLLRSTHSQRYWIVKPSVAYACQGTHVWNAEQLQHEYCKPSHIAFILISTRTSKLISAMPPGYATTRHPVGQAKRRKKSPLSTAILWLLCSCGYITSSHLINTERTLREKAEMMHYIFL